MEKLSPCCNAQCVNGGVQCEACGAKVCEFCGGSGEVETMEYVYPGEPHMAPIGTQKCVCKVEKKEE